MTKIMSVQITQFKELLSAVGSFGAITDIEIELKFEKGEGLDVEGSDIFSTNSEELFVILEKGFIRKAVIHIVDISSWRWGNYPKFHIYNCRTIESMKSKGRKHRYKASSRKDSKFYLIKKEQKWYQELEICAYCLSKYNNQFKQDKTKQTFSHKKWIEKPIDTFSKVELDICTVPNCYTENWSKISKKIKEQEKYICSKCKGDFSDKECRDFLHTHHIDADKRNNIKENLKALCIECHSNEYNHGHIKHNPMYKKWLKSKCYKIQNKK